MISLRSRSPRLTSAAPDGAATTASEPEASRNNVHSGGTHDECSPALRAGCAPAGKVLASQARHPCRLIAPGCATCRRLGFRVINPPRGPNVRRLPQPIRRLLLLTHPSDLELPGVDLLPHQSEANSLPLRVAPGTTDEHVDVGHAPPSLPSDPDWCHDGTVRDGENRNLRTPEDPDARAAFLYESSPAHRRLQGLRNTPDRPSRTAIALPNRSVHTEISHAVSPAFIGRPRREPVREIQFPNRFRPGGARRWRPWAMIWPRFGRRGRSGEAPLHPSRRRGRDQQGRAADVRPGGRDPRRGGAVRAALSRHQLPPRLRSRGDRPMAQDERRGRDRRTSPTARSRSVSPASSSRSQSPDDQRLDDRAAGDAGQRPAFDCRGGAGGAGADAKEPRDRPRTYQGVYERFAAWLAAREGVGEAAVGAFTSEAFVCYLDELEVAVRPRRLEGARGAAKARALPAPAPSDRRDRGADG